MSLNATEIAAVAADLDARLRGTVVQRVREDAAHPDRIVLRLRGPGENHDLLIDVGAETGRLHLVGRTPPAPQEPAPFVMLLRKHLSGAGLERVAVVEGDRVVRLSFYRGDERPDLLAELTGRHGNLFALDTHGVVLGSVLPNRSRRRDLRPGRPWLPPEPRDAPVAPLRASWPTAALHEWLESTFGGEADAMDAQAAQTAAASRVRRERQRMAKRVVAIERDLARAEDADGLTRRAELLKGAWGKVERGATSVQVQDWYEEGAPLVTVALDPALSLQENVERMFHHARRFKRGRQTAEARLLDAMQAVESLDDALRAIGEAADPDAVIAELTRARLLPPDRSARQAAKAGDTPRLPYHPFRSSDGLDIFVGRGGVDNDRVTFGVARGRDLWLHARDWPGSHVIVVMPRAGDPPQRTLHEAAVLAAHFSKGAADGVVAVHWTRRSEVRKPRGMPPGRVTLSGARGIDVRLDPDEVRRVLDLRVP